VPYNLRALGFHTIHYRKPRRMQCTPHYIKEARWRTIQGSTGYFVNIPIRPLKYYPVKFNHIYKCWCEIMWNAPENLWNIVRPTGPDYWCDIFEDKVQAEGSEGQINGQPPIAPRTPAPSTADS